jgi:glycosyltransferase involved in cell wall biosynthesis
MKRVLFLAYLFPPITNSGTQRSLKFAKYLAGYGWEPIVLTASQFHGHHTDPDLLEDLPASIRVVRVPMLNEHIGQSLSSLLGSGAIARRIGDGVRWRMQNHRRPPDFHSWWQPTAFRAAMRVHKDTGFDAILATGYPWTSLVTGCAVSKATGVPIVADFRDLWAGEHLFREERPDNADELALEHGVVDQATYVVAASGGIARQLAAAHADIDPGKFVTIHNGFDPVDLDVSPAPRTAERRFRIVFTGVWKDGYNPAELYDAIDWIRRTAPALLESVEVITAGFAPGEARRRGLGNHITERGVVPHREAVALMRSADLLYLSHVDRARQWVVPGKLYEYLASGVPVLALTPADDETARIISRVGGGVALSPDHPGAFREALAEACRRQSFAVPPRNAGALAAFERRNLTGRLAATLDDAWHQTTRSRRAESSDGETSISYAGSTSEHPMTRVVS